MAPRRTLLQKLLKTIFLVIVWITIGLCLEMSGPTMKDLILILDSNYELVSRAISGRSVGFFVGAVIGGFLVDKLRNYCDLFIAVCIDGMAACAAAAPYSPNVSTLWALFFIGGTFEGVINIAGQKLILELWLEKASSPMHALHLGFGIGSFITPQVANPFLAEVKSIYPESAGSNFTSQSPMTTISMQSSTIQEVIKDSTIHWAYLIVAIVSAIVSLVFYAYQISALRNNSTPEETAKDEFNQERKEKESEKTKDGEEKDGKCTNMTKNFIHLVDPATCSFGERWYGTQIFILLFFHFFMCTGAERVYGKFIRNFAIDQFQFSNDLASLLNTSFWISFSLGRFAGFATGRWIPIRLLLVIECAGVLLCGILLISFAGNDSTMLWVLTQPMAFFIAPLFPSGVAWGDFHLEFTGMAITFLLFGGGIGGMCHMWIIGYIYDKYSHSAFLYHSFGLGCALVFFATLLTLRSRGKGNRFKNKPDLPVADVNINETFEVEDEDESK